MKKFGQGMIVGFLLATLLISGIAWASNPIKLIVNEQEIKTDVAPQMINSRVFVPVRFAAEALGAQVEWDPENWAVIITSTLSTPNSTQNVDLIATDWVALRDIASSANVIVTDKVYIEKNDVKIVLDPHDYTFTVIKAGSVVDSGQAKLENDTTYLPLPILQKYGLR